MPLKITIPATPLDLYKTGLVKPAQYTWFAGVVKAMRRAYDAYLTEVDAMHNVPADVLCTLISIENPDASEPNLRRKMERIVTGNPRSGACGLCQIDCQTADATLRTEAQNQNLSAEEIAFFRTKLGARFDTIVSGKPGFGTWRSGTQQLVHTIGDLQDPRYNLHIGGLRFGQLMRAATEADGTIRLDRAIVKYNGSAAPLPPVGSSIAAVLASQKGKNKGRDRNTTYKYILKFVGTNGGMDLLTRAARTA